MCLDCFTIAYVFRVSCKSGADASDFVQHVPTERIKAISTMLMVPPLSQFTLYTISYFNVEELDINAISIEDTSEVRDVQISTVYDHEICLGRNISCDKQR